MSQIKDSARLLPTWPSESLRSSGSIAIGGQISGLLTRRNRLVEELAEIDAKLADLRSVAANDPAAALGAACSFPLRGEQLRAGGFAIPSSLDRADLNRRLAGVLSDDRKRGLALDGLEILVSFQPQDGRVLSVRTRRAGEADWTARFEAGHVGAGH